MRPQHKNSIRNNRAALNFSIYVHLTILLFLLVSSKCFAQEEPASEDPKYLLKDPGNKGVVFSTFYGEIAPTTAFATVSNELGKVFLMEFGVHLNRKFTIGYYLARSPKTNAVAIPEEGTDDYQQWLDAGVELDQLPSDAEQVFLYFSHSGINLAYMHKTERVLFWRAGIRFGTGKLTLLESKKQLLDFFNTPVFERRVANLNPEVGLGVNLRNWWRFHLDVGYHFVFATKEGEIADPQQFSGPTLKAGFAFGNFKN